MRILLILPLIYSCIHIQNIRLRKFKRTMKRRSHTSSTPTSKIVKQPQKLQSSSTHKVKNTQSKSNHQEKSKVKNKKNNGQIIQDYLMINDNVYQVSTKTEREEVKTFVNRFKRQVCYEKSKKYCVGSNGSKKNIIQEVRKVKLNMSWQENSQARIQQIVKNLPTQRKMMLMRQLEKQLSNNPQFTTQGSIHQSRSAQKQRQKQSEKEKEKQRNKIKQIKQQKQQQQEQNEQKYNILNIRLHNLQKQLTEKRSNQIQKVNKLFYEGQLTASQRKYQISSIDKVKERKIKIINCTRNLFYTLLHNKFQPQQFKGGNIDEVIRDLDSFQDIDSCRVENGGMRKNQAESSIQSQIDFEKIGGELKSAEKGDRADQRNQNSDKKSNNEQSLLISPDKSAQKAERQKQKQKQIDSSINFECSQQSVSIAKKLHIPLLLTKQKIQEMEWQKKSKAMQKMRTQIDRKISFQMSQLQVEIQDVKNHFTTLADINGFIVSLYEHIIRKDLQHVVSRLNMPFGKATRDKLFLLQQNGQIDDLQYYPVLDQSHLNGFNMETALTVRRFSDQEKIHNKAVFDNFNVHLNAYRPYYDLEGDVYPWFVSEKGLTFYEINEENIQEVFQKTKIKVLEECSTLCGLIPFGIDASEAPEILKQKNNQNFQKEEKLSLVQNFGKWGIKLMDYDTMVRLLLAQQILNKQIQDFITQMQKF